MAKCLSLHQNMQLEPLLSGEREQQENKDPFLRGEREQKEKKDFFNIISPPKIWRMSVVDCEINRFLNPCSGIFSMVSFNKHFLK